MTHSDGEVVSELLACEPRSVPRPMVPIARLLSRLQVDRAVAFGVLARIWTLGSGPVTMILIASSFTREVQGYYYTFGSLLALQVFAELGLGQVILQFASHEWAHLSLDEQGRIVGDRDALSRLVSLGQFAFRWYGIASGLVAVGLGAAGFVFFSRSPQIGIDWVRPWFVLCILTGINLLLIPLWSLLEGCNQVARVYGYRLVQGILSSLSGWTAILLGASLWTGAVVSLAALVCSVLFLYWRYRRFIASFLVRATGPRISWRDELWSLQWRIALSWLSGYFGFSLFTPVLFYYQGPAVAGQTGMTWAMVSALSGISFTWVFTKAPQFGMLVARKDYAGLDRLVLRSAVMAFSVACAGAIAIEGFVCLLYVSHHPLAIRLLPPLPTALFLLATVLLQLSYPQAAYLRAHKREPFMVLSVVCGLLIASLTILLGSRYGATGVAAGYLAVVALWNLPVGTVIWCRCRKAWHVVPADQTSCLDSDLFPRSAPR